MSKHQGQRMGMVIGLNPEKVAKYKALHAQVWPENLLFGYWEYVGSDFAADMRKMAESPKNQEWWSVCMPCQKPLETRKEGEWWAMMEEVFHHD
ncbi:hypothetical protein H721_00235 [Brucella ovis IntaBari-2006-46-332]|uniref:L-rhamnose mutarotase n=1 Tax=Brucella ovis (strain ATCC 25840 / 63/290 / NCTC 10512) TaxID=444178 RepID=A0A0H3AQD6_BRUO2|nr:L-rhamnose mutarotase [Brucella ovis]ABQ60876.1 conserved hypothetical protein [Brucella ovis ATCC 25840]ENR06205.1 hypothetical protein C010_00208 [Brucella ovis 80/125]ENR10495.1 hypothetical protein C961_00210 [Brucella ovis F8/05B]ENS96399.1 hypothetical protein B999_00546 [Brucella ovis 63/96]ENT01416.1 hypothetical protein C009_00225 [Brucella ovis 81/8]